MEIISKKEEAVLNWLKLNNESLYTILDIGANKGFYSESLLNILDNRIEVIYAFEPVKENYEQCLIKFNKNNKVKLFNKACSEKNGKIEFNQIISDNIAVEGLSSINYRKVFDNFKCIKIIVDTIVIDDFLTINSENDLFVKIDTEGHELEVMLGMVNLFKSNKIICLQFEYGDCMLEQQKNLNDIIHFINQFDNYDLCDFDIIKKIFITINSDNINDYINKSWENLYIIRK